MNNRAVNPTPVDAPKCPQCGTPLPTGALAGLCPACLLAQGAAADTVTDGKQPPFNPPPVAELAPLFPQLEILELIGKGGMGAVYKARQKQLDRIVALKILPPGIGDDLAFAERFAREARALAKLNHPGIVTLYEFGRADLPVGPNIGAAQQRSSAGQLYFFLMEFVDGVNLRQLLHAGRISPREALAIVPQICDPLQFAHDQGIVHRDIKPENILLDRRGRVKVADFGLAKIVEGRDALTRVPADLPVSPDIGAAQQHGPTGVMGTPNYMAPEQVSHPADVDHRADIYALGVVFYQMLTGELPGKRLEPPSRKVQIDVRLDEVVLRALEKNPELRYQQVSEVKTQVETIAGTPSQSKDAPFEVPIRAGESLYATAEYLASTWGAMKLHEGLGRLMLYSGRLMLNRGWQSTEIPFRAVHKLSVASYPFWLSLAGLRSILVEFEEAGQLRRLMLTPRKGMFSFAAESNRRVAEWFLTIREAITVANGKPPAGSAIPELYCGFSSIGMLWARLTMAFVPTVLLAFLIFFTVSDAKLQSLLPVALLFILPIGIAMVVARTQRKQWLRDNPLPQTESERRQAENEHQRQSVPPLAVATDWPRIVRRAVRVGFVVWVMTVAVATIVTFLLPESYRAAARIMVERDNSAIEELTGKGAVNPYDPYFIQTEVEIIQSRLVLEPVIQQLNLEKRWSPRYAAGQKLGLPETLQLLKNRLELRPVRSTALIDIGVFSELRDEPAELANAIAESYVNYRSNQLPASNELRMPTGRAANELLAAKQSWKVLIVEKATQPLHPARPNRPLNIALGALAGVFFGGIAALITGLVAWGKQQHAAAVPPSVSKDRFWRRFATAVALVVVALALIPASLILLRLFVSGDLTLNQSPLVRSPSAAGTTVSQPVTPTLAFGPVVERVLYTVSSGQTNCIDFDRGEVGDLPSELEANYALKYDWMAARGFDALVWRQDGLACPGMATADATPVDWDTLPATAVAGLLANAEKLDAPALQTWGKLPSAWVFRTREGGLGLLQITGFTENPRGVKLHYKLVQTSPGLKTSASLDAANASDGDSRRSGSTGLVRPDTTIRAAGGKVIVDDANERLTADQVTLGPSNTLTATGSNIMYEVRGRPAPK